MQNRGDLKLKIVQYLESDDGRKWIDEIDNAAGDDAEFDKRAAKYPPIYRTADGGIVG